MSAITASATTGEYEDFCATVLETTGVELALYRRSQMERRALSFARHAGLAGLGEYGDLIRRDAAARACFMQQLTINVSQLWRNPAHWIALEHFVVPELMASHRTLRAWCAGVSYGAEAYTLAALCSEVLTGAKVEIVGTDIDRRMVERARAGAFSGEDARTMPSAQRQRWFTERDGMLHADPKLKALCRFETGDLLTMRPARQAYDLVLCRNTVIYFNAEVKDALHARLAEALVPGGYLMVGSTERVAEPGALGLQTTHPFVYRKVS